MTSMACSSPESISAGPSWASSLSSTASTIPDSRCMTLSARRTCRRRRVGCPGRFMLERGVPQPRSNRPPASSSCSIRGAFGPSVRFQHPNGRDFGVGRRDHTRLGCSKLRCVRESRPLVAADESFDHERTDDAIWTEKVCAMAALVDGSVQAAFGMGKYANRNVLDAYAGDQPRHRAVDGAGVAGAGPRRRPTRRRTDHLRGARAARSCASRWPRTTSCRSASTGSSAPRCRARSKRSRASKPASCATTRSARPKAGSPSTACAASSTDANSVSTRDHSWGVRRMVGVPDARRRTGPT